MCTTKEKRSKGAGVERSMARTACLETWQLGPIQHMVVLRPVQLIALAHRSQRLGRRLSTSGKQGAQNPLDDLSVSRLREN